MTCFALVDCNNFFVSCERLFRPDLEGIPVVVLSSNDGCIISRSNEAKALGFQMGDPYHLSKERLKAHNVTVFSSNHELYGDMSRRVMQTLKDHAPQVEVYSVDEAFLNLEGLEHLGLETYTRNLQSIIQRHTGMPVSIGIAPTKTLSKIAARIAKTNKDLGGVVELTNPLAIDTALSTTPVSAIWGIGRKWCEWLMACGITTALDLSRSPPKMIRSHMGVIGERIIYELRGMSCLPLDLVTQQKQGLCVSRSFGKPITNINDVQEALFHHVQKACEKLRYTNLQASNITVFLQTARNATTKGAATQARSTLPFPTDYTPDFNHKAMLLLKQQWKEGHIYTKVGVMLGDLTSKAPHYEQNKTQEQDHDHERCSTPAQTPPHNPTPRDLFDDRNTVREDKLMEAMDRINHRFGPTTLMFGGSGCQSNKKPIWSAREAMLSPCYTTRWEDLRVVM